MSNLSYLSAELRQDLITLIARQTGIEIREQNYSTLADNVRSRVRNLNLVTPEAYYNLLSSGTAESDREWQNFVCLMTNKESYFFRDKGQFILLRNNILPELIKRKQNQRILRICSAGCSTGQEPYSIAILLRQMIPDFSNWHITILGVDINKDALTQAKNAVYNPWSFRQVDDEIKQKYFQIKNEQYCLNNEIRNLVKFQRVNLARDIFPQPDTEFRDMDLIICRNVFIYFVDSAITAVVEKFYNTLLPGGYLLTGHAELTAQQVKGFQVHLFPESVIYQRGNQWGDTTTVMSRKKEESPEESALERLHRQLQKTIIKPAKTPASFPIKPKPVTSAHVKIEPIQTIAEESPLAPLDKGGRLKGETSKVQETPAKSQIEELLQEVENLIAAKSYFLAGKKVEQALSLSPRSFQAHYLQAQIHANLGRYDEATKSCHQAIDIDSFSVAPYHLLFQIAEEKGDVEEAKQLLKKIIYLEPCSVAAYWNLAALYEHSGDNQRARKMQQSALKILRGLPGDTKVPELGDVTVDVLISQLE